MGDRAGLGLARLEPTAHPQHRRHHDHQPGAQPQQGRTHRLAIPALLVAVGWLAPGRGYRHRLVIVRQLVGLRLGNLRRPGARRRIGQRGQPVPERRGKRALGRIWRRRDWRGWSARRWSALRCPWLPAAGRWRQQAIAPAHASGCWSEAAAAGDCYPDCRRSGARDRSRKTHLSQRTPRTLRTLHYNGSAGLLILARCEAARTHPFGVGLEQAAADAAWRSTSELAQADIPRRSHGPHDPLGPLGK